jgi:hypothetical protein
VGCALAFSQIMCSFGAPPRQAPPAAAPPFVEATATPILPTSAPPVAGPPTIAVPTVAYLPTPEQGYVSPDFGAPVAFDKRVVRPINLDPATDALPDKEHLILFPSDRRLLEPLFIFLSGSSGQPANNQRILEIAARAGYRSVGLAYVNDISVNDRCQGKPDDCPGMVRLENLDGMDRGAYIEVERANSIEHRIIRLLQALSAGYPGEGWDAYLVGETIQWERIVIAGFSQGGGQAALIAGEHLVARAAYVDFGGDLVGDSLLNVAAAPWVTEPRVTPPERQFSILHQANHFEPKGLYHEAIGITAFGPYALVETAEPPYGWTHTLLTNALPATGTYADAHVSMANDRIMAVDENGIPLLADSYYYMFAP